MGGHQLRNAPSDGVSLGEKLYVRALVFDDGSKRAAFVEAASTGMRDHDRLRKAIASATGIPAGNILLGDVHNHSAPAPDTQRNADWTRQFESSLAWTRLSSRRRPDYSLCGSRRERAGRAWA